MPTLNGLPACDCLAQWYPAFEAELRGRGVLPATKSIRIYQLIGGAPQSGGTHSTGGAGDDDQVSQSALIIAREMGADASWNRPLNWDGAGGMAHAHRVLRGCPHNGPARYQIVAVDAGFNGLGRAGMGAIDDGPRPLSKRTWQQGLAWQKKQARKRAITATILKLRGRIGRLKVKRGSL